MNRKKVLLVYRHHAPFIENDYKILKKHFDVSLHKTTFSPKNILKLFLSIKNNYLTISWFANWSAFISLIFSKLWKKKFVVIAGGLDATWILKDNKIKNLEVNGLFEIFQRLISKIIFNYADLVLPVSNFTKRGVMLISKPKKIKTVYNGVPYIKKRKITKKKIVITVGAINEFNTKKKGFITFAKVSRLFPNISFLIIGRYNEKSLSFRILNSIGKNNLKFTGYLDKNLLYKIMNKAKIYCQLSYSESFGYALAEAMLHGCIPIVTKRTALTEVVGDAGIYVNYGDVAGTAKAIKKVLNMSNKLGYKARERILKHFSLKEREKKLVNILKTVI